MKLSSTQKPLSGGRLPSILDREHGDNSNDAFGHNHFAKALEDLIEHEDRKPPFSIGLLGAWGTGKSTIKELYLQGLKLSKTTKGSTARNAKIFPITFNAWRHGGEDDLKRALLRAVYLKLGGNEDDLDEELFNQINVTASRRRPLSDWFSEAFGQIFFNGLAFVLLLAASFGVVWIVLSSLEQSSDVTMGGGALLAFAFAAYAIRHLVTLRLHSPTLFQPRTSISFPARSAEEYEKLLLRQIAEFLRKSHTSVERLVIFVDDLDRLSAAEMVRGLDAIRSFLELPLGEFKKPIGVVFVLSCDEDRVAEALHSKLYWHSSEGLPGTVFSKTDARRYLDRLFQFRLEIPPFPKQDMRKFARGKLEGLSGVMKEFEAKDVPVDTVIDTLIHVGVQSPRNSIQLLNAFLHSWWMASERETAGRGSQATGVLYDGAVTAHPIMLAALTVLKVDFPDFYDRIQTRPEFLEEFRQVLFGRQNPYEFPTSAVECMEPYLEKREGKLTSTVRREHGALRQYLASIEGLRRPKSLQPLLCLAVDPISRSFGDGAHDVFGALVSGDAQGVIDTLGRALDTEPLTTAQTGLLRDLVERAMEDTESRRISASRVLAHLSPRIVGVDRRFLLTPLVRQLIALKDVREQVGPNRAMDIIADVTQTDQREVAGAFIDDLMQGGPIEWRKIGGGAPSIDELSEIVQSTATLAIAVWRLHGLEARHEAKLRGWLLDRTVESSEGTVNLPFSYLNALIAENHQTLLPSLNPHYAEQAIEVLQSEVEAVTDISSTLKHVQSEFGRLSASGQEDRELLWQLLSRLISVRNSTATKIAWDVAGVHKGLANAAQASAFLGAFASRLERDLSGDETWKVEWPEGGSQFVDLLNNWREYLTDNTAEPLVELIALWARTENCEDLSIRCMAIVQRHSTAAWNKVAERVLSDDFGEISHEIAQYIGTALQHMTDANSETLRGQLDTVVNNDNPDSGNAAVYRTFITAASLDIWQTEPWASHLRQVASRFGQMHSSPDYVDAILPAISGLTHSMRKGSAGGFISSLFANAAGQPEAYVAAHRAFHGNWPDFNDDGEDYQPDQLASRACQFIRENAAIESIGVVFRSLVELKEKNLVSSTVYNDIAPIIPIIWRVAPTVLLAHDDSIAPIVTTNEVVEIATGAQPSKVEENALPTLLKTISDSHDHQLRIDTAQAILNVQAVPIVDHPDGALAIWLSAIGDESDAVATTLFSDAELNDEQALRLAMLLPLSFWRLNDWVPFGSVLKDSSRPRLQDYLISKLSDLSQTVGDGTTRTELTSRLIDSLPQLNPSQIQTTARTINSLQGRSALERAEEVVKGLGSEQLDSLLEIFPASRYLQKARQAHDE